MKEKGKLNREIRKYFGISKIQLRNLITRYNPKSKQISGYIIAKERGRPREKPLSAQEELEHENKRLKMENELLRSFLEEIERG